MRGREDRAAPVARSGYPSILVDKSLDLQRSEEEELH